MSKNALYNAFSFHTLKSKYFLFDIITRFYYCFRNLFWTLKIGFLICVCNLWFLSPFTHTTLNSKGRQGSWRGIEENLSPPSKNTFQRPCRTYLCTKYIVPLLIFEKKSSLRVSVVRECARLELNLRYLLRS